MAFPWSFSIKLLRIHLPPSCWLFFYQLKKIKSQEFAGWRKLAYFLPWNQSLSQKYVFIIPLNLPIPQTSLFSYEERYMSLRLTLEYLLWCPVYAINTYALLLIYWHDINTYLMLLHLLPVYVTDLNTKPQYRVCCLVPTLYSVVVSSREGDSVSTLIF